MATHKKESTRERIDSALASMRTIAKSNPRRSVTRSRARRGSKPRPLRYYILRFLGGLLVFFFVVLLPFFLLLRVATELYVVHELNHWVAIGGGMLSAGVVLLLYAQFVSVQIGKGAVLRKGAGRVIAMVVVAYCAYGLLYLSATNAKTEKVASSYTRLHPILRLSVSTWLLVDPNALLTDTERIKSDYQAMGLSPMERSLHYRQSDGYAHAVDMRTIGRTDMRNTIAAFYFRVLGFNTLRHVGSADHLHISLPLPGDGAI